MREVLDQSKQEVEFGVREGLAKVVNSQLCLQFYLPLHAAKFAYCHGLARRPYATGLLRAETMKSFLIH